MLSNIVRNVQHFGRRIVGPIQTTDSMRGTVQRDCGTARRARDAILEAVQTPRINNGTVWDGVAVRAGDAAAAAASTAEMFAEMARAGFAAGNVLTAEQVQALGDLGRIWSGVRDTIIDANRRVMALRDDAKALPNGSEGDVDDARTTKDGADWSERSRAATREGLDSIRRAHAEKWTAAKPAATTDQAPPARTEQARQAQRVQNINEENRRYWATQSAG